MCDAVTDTTGSGSVLADLERSGMFFSVDMAGQWYQSHQLFQEALRVELARAGPDLVPVLHVRAARWFEETGDLLTATEHAIAERDVPRVGRLLAAQAQPMAATGRRDTIRRWLALLDWPEAKRDPEIAYARAVDAGLHSELTDVEQWLDLASSGPPDQLDANGIPLSFRVGYVRSITAVHDITQAEATGRRAAHAAPFPAFEGMAWGGVGQALYLQDRFDEARECLTRAIGLIPDANPIMLASARANLVLVETAQRPSVPPAWILEGIGDLLRRTGADNTPAAALVDMAMGEVQRNRGNLAAAAVHLEPSLEILGSDQRTSLHANALLLLSRVQRDAGDVAGSLSSIDAADAILRRQRDPGALPARSRALRQRLTSSSRMAAGFGQVLTERETAVLRLLGEGWSQREIAGRLFVTHNTVKSHLQSCYRKLGVTTRDGAIDALRRADLPHRRSCPRRRVDV